jgi:ADP-ribose pyrophosphatase YjhB (NUDIX family)
MTTAAPTVAVAAVVFDEHGAVLLIERGRPPGAGLWTVPGGRLELGEALTAGVAREVREETGLEVEVGALIEIVERVTPAEGGVYHYVILDYLARVVGGALGAGSDARAARFVPPGELAALPLTEGLLPVLARARALAAVWDRGLAPAPAGH